MMLNFAALGMLPLPEVTAIGFVAPILMVVFAAMFLGEEVRLFRLGAVVLGLVGVLIVLSPRLSTLSADEMGSIQTLGAMLALMSATSAALAQIFIRKMVATERTSAIVFWFTITSTVISLFTIPFGWVIPAPREALMLISAGILGGLGQIMLTSSYRFAQASVVAPFHYASMLFALLIGYFVFGEVPTLTILAGAALVIFAGVLIIWRENRLRIDRTRPKRAQQL